MPLYRFYRISELGRRQPSDDIECDNDVAAIVAASKIADPPGVCEVWLGSRKVGSSHFVARSGAG